MKRSFVRVIVLLLLVVGVPLVVAGQDSKAVWDLSESLQITDLGLNVSYPSGWVYKQTESNGILAAENDADLAAVTDDDPATVATGTYAQFIATKLANLKESVGENPTLEQLADLLVKSRGITEKDKRAEVPVVSRRSLSVLGENDAKQGLILTIWQQGDFVMGSFLTSPSYDETLKVAYSWGQVIGSITPIDPLPLGKELVALPATKAQINLPDGWFPNPDQPNALFELETDIKKDTPESYRLTVSEVTLADAKLKDTATVSDVVDLIVTNLGLTEPVKREEFMILGQPAITIMSPMPSGQYVLSAQAVVDGTIVQVAVIAPDEEKATAFEPTFLAILQSLKAAKAS